MFLFVLQHIRIQLLEIENKRNGTRKISDAEANNNAEALESLTQELSVMRKDSLTAERIAKQSEVIQFNLLFFFLFFSDTLWNTEKIMNTRICSQNFFFF